MFNAIEHISGVQIKDTGVSLGIPEVFVRGATPGILLNDRDSRHFANHYSFDPNLIDMNVVDRIEVLKGPQSTMHGGRSVSGAINVIMKKGDRNHPFLNLKSGIGSGGLVIGGLTAGGGIGEKLSYIVSVYGDKKDKFKTPNGVIPFNSSKKQNFYSRLDYDISDGHALTFEYTYNKSRHSSGSEAQIHPDYLADKAIWKLDPSFLESLYIDYNGKFNEIFSIYSTLGAGKHNYDYVYGSNDHGVDVVKSYLTKENHSSMKNDFLYGELRGILNLISHEKLRLLAGIQSRSSKLDWKIFENYKFFNRIKETETYFAPYIQVEYRPIRQIFAIAGVRYDNFGYSKASSKSAVSSRASLSYFPFIETNYNYTTLWGSYTQSFNPPDATHLFGYGVYVKPNLDIKPERTQGWEFGIKQKIMDWANIEFSYFDTKYKDKIAVTFSKTPFMFENIDKVGIKGIEAKVEFYPTDWLMIFANYTAFDKKNRVTNKRLDDGQANRILQYGLSIYGLKDFYTSLVFNRLGDYKNTAIGIKNHPSENKTIVNFRMSQKLKFKNDILLEPYLSINNLTDITYYAGLIPTLTESRSYEGGVNFKMDF